MTNHSADTFTGQKLMNINYTAAALEPDQMCDVIAPPTGIYNESQDDEGDG